jgi:O-acetylhomoserine/O-acetylserine sulfhydrylase
MKTVWSVFCVYPNALRISLGLEHIDDIKADIDGALKHI